MRCAASILIAALLTVGPSFEAFAQDQEAAGGQENLRVFIDCESYLCDFDYFREEIQFVNYVRNRQDAAVHVLVTTQRTGGGGREFTLDLIGRGRFEGSEQSLTYTATATASEDEIRQGLVRILKAGLMPYVTSTPSFDQVEISYERAEEGPQQATREEDPWNFWVFRTSLRGYFRGEERTSYRSLSSSVSANRTTKTWKSDFSLYGNYNENNFDINDSTTVTNTRRSYGSRGLVVRSLSDHWSIGATASARNSSFYNYDLAAEVNPAVEYNLFPYSESTRRQLRFLYEAGVSHFDYGKVTIFNKEQQTLLDHALTVTLDVNQEWGSIRASVEGSQYFFDLSKNRLDVFSNLELQLVKGLSLDLFGRYSFIHDQLYLAREGLTPEEILLQRRQLATGYEYYVSVGISYTFGSIYNNVVNPRFGR